MRARPPGLALAESDIQPYLDAVKKAETREDVARTKSMRAAAINRWAR